MEKIIFSLEAVSSILVECYRTIKNIETGGVLVGPRKFKRIVTDIIPSSIYAERQTATYYQSEKDVKILNLKLRQFQLNGYDFKGYFHKHPSGMFQLSHGDRRTCADIIQSPNYHINNFLIMCIITESHVQDFPLFSYAVSLSNTNNILVHKTDIHVLPRTCIKESFEPLKEGVSHESNSSKQHIKRTKKETTSNVIRVTGKRNSDSKLPKIDKRA
tara:strand:- start:277 stop:924 length:648 start_codon:yes stop_codon:yes gene_type:complete